MAETNELTPTSESEQVLHDEVTTSGALEKAPEVTPSNVLDFENVVLSKEDEEKISQEIEQALNTPQDVGSFVVNSIEYSTASKDVRVNSRDYSLSNLKVRNWSNPGVGQFTGNRIKGKRKTTAVSGFVIHETRGLEIKWSVSVKTSLENRKDEPNLGVHGYVDYDGTFIQNNDLIDRLNHCAAPGFKNTTIGFEIINPVVEFYKNNKGVLTKKNLPKDRYQKIYTTWDRGKYKCDHYLIPSKEQLEAVTLFILWLTTQSQLSIPCLWPGISSGDRRMMLVNTLENDDCLKSGNGIVAHGQLQTNKSDGIFPLIYSWLRIEAGFDAESAYLEAQKLLGAENLKAGEKYIDLTAY